MQHSLKRIIPNSITSANLICGAISVFLSTQGKIDFAFYFILLGAFFDFFDGFAARLLKVQSEFGVQLDSLADMVTFGVAPAFMLFKISYENYENIILQFFPFIIIAFSALRLAKFNIDKRQTSGFIGLPTPASSLLTGSIIFSAFMGNEFYSSLLSSGYFIIIYSILLSFLLVSELPLFSFKMKSLGFKENYQQYLFIICAVILISLFKISSLPIIILIYILIGIINLIANANTSK